MQFAIHKSEQRYLRHFTFADKNSIVGAQPKGWNVKVRKVIRAKNILLFAIELCAILCLKRDEDKQEHQPGPPSVDDAYEVKLPGKKDWNK